MKIQLEQIQSLPKILLHEHLDGGVRPETLIKFAQKYSISLPRTMISQLKKWFVDQSKGSLEYCIKAFDLTCSIMQTIEALEQIAYEALVDAAKDNIIYAEIRFCPTLHTKHGLNLHQVMDSVIRGFERAKADFGIEYGIIICAIRSLIPEINYQLAKLTSDYFGNSVVGFDVAGLERGFPLTRHESAIKLIHTNQIPLTIHAGEAVGIESISEAINFGASRIGHASTLLSGLTEKHQHLAHYIKTKNIHLEINLSSNLITGVVKNLASHPFIQLYQEGYNLALNTDDTLMFNTTLSNEYFIACNEYNLNLDDIYKMNLNALNSSFAPIEKKTKCKNKFNYKI